MKDVVIKIVGTQNYGKEDGDDSIELVTDGKYSFSGGRGEIFYSESELTGMEGRPDEKQLRARAEGWRPHRSDDGLRERSL